MTTTDSTTPTTPGPRQWLATAVLGAALSLVLGACSYHPPAGPLTPEAVARILNSSPYATALSSDRRTTFEDAQVTVQHGTSCARASRAATATSLGVRVSEEAAIKPGYQATVFLNGWDAEYTRGDHHVTGLGMAIFNVVRNGDTLFWDAGGLISDKNGDDEFRWCYRYTLMQWSPAASGVGVFNRVDMAPLVSQVGQRLITVDDGFSKQNPVMSLPAAFETTTQSPRGKLFMGFALSFTRSDHHVLQHGFDYGRSTLSGQRIAWTSKAILQDKNADDETQAAAISTLLTGASVHEWQPATVRRVGGPAGPTTVANQITLAKRTGERFCAVVGDMKEQVQEYAIDGVPFRYAVPMLTGWKAGYSCNDHHLRRTGVSIDDFRYERAPNAATGTLFYTVRTAMKDDGGHDASSAQVAVTVLGLDLVGTAKLPAGGLVASAF